MMNNRVAVSEVLALCGAMSLTCVMPQAKAQSTHAPSYQTLKTSNRTLEAKMRHMQNQIANLQCQVERLKRFEAIRTQTYLGSLPTPGTGYSPFYQVPQRQAPKPPLLSNIPDSKVVLLSEISR